MPVHQDVVHEANHAYAATTRALTPVSRVGWIIGAKRGLWLVGSELSVPSFFALSYTSGSSPPKNQNTAGVCHSAPKHPKSSLAIVGLVCSTEPSGKFRRNASTTFSVASTSFVTNEYRSSGVISGTLGAPEAAASAFTIRSIAASTCLRTP